MKKILKAVWQKFLTIFGEIKISRYPMWIIYDPEFYKMSGSKMLEVIEHLKPGDVLLRGYDGYADTYFIPETEKHGRYSHAGLYIGGNRIIHAVAPYVQEIDVVEFMECDRICVLRPKKQMRAAVKKAFNYLNDRTGYDFDFKAGSESLYCFELCAECYDKLDIPRKDASILFGLIKRRNCYLAQSFFDSKDFRRVFEYNPGSKIDYSQF